MKVNLEPWSTLNITVKYSIKPVSSYIVSYQLCCQVMPTYTCVGSGATRLESSSMYVCIIHQMYKQLVSITPCSTYHRSWYTLGSCCTYLDCELRCPDPLDFSGLFIQQLSSSFAFILNFEVLQSCVILSISIIIIVKTKYYNLIFKENTKHLVQSYFQYYVPSNLQSNR